MDSQTLRVGAAKVVCSAVVLVAIGLLSVWIGQAWLVASLGSATFIQVLTPHEPSARIWPTAAGQACGIVGGYAGVYAAFAWAAPRFEAGDPLAMRRVLAVLVAVAVTAALQLGLRARCAAGGALALLLALGQETPDWAGLARLAVGVALVTFLGEFARRIVLSIGPPAQGSRAA